MSSAIMALAETRASWCSSQAFSARTRGLLLSWRTRGVHRRSARGSFSRSHEERPDAFERFARDWRIAVLGEVEEAAAQMGPAEGERDGLARRSVGDALVRRIAIALHDTAVAIKQLEGLHCAAPRSVGVGDCRRVGSAPRPVIPGMAQRNPFL